MKLLKEGKTKDVFLNDDGTVTFKFKNTVTGHASSGTMDPGGNQVVGEVAGVGMNALKVTTYYFELFNKLGIKSHYISSDIKNMSMKVKFCEFFGKGLEFVVRYVQTGSFVRRYALYAKEGAPLKALCEVTLKDDERDDPLITKESVVALKLMTAKQYDTTVKLSKQISNVIKDDLKKKGLKLYDIKLEFGLVDDEIVLIDEVSAGNMRAYKGKKKLDYAGLSAEILK